MTTRCISPRLALLVIAMGMAAGAQAYQLTIGASPRSVFLRVGDGGAGYYNNSGGVPGSSTEVNKVAVTLTAASLVGGAPQPMGTDANQANSSLDNFAFCNVPAQIYVGGFNRGTGGTATLKATVPASLQNAATDTIPFSQISWTSSGNGDTGVQPIPAGTFAAGATQTLATFPANTWIESCHSFTYANSAIRAAGTYNGQVLYTLSVP